MVLNWIKVASKWRNIYTYTENIRIVSLMAGLVMEGIVKWRGLKSQDPLYMDGLNTCISPMVPCPMMRILYSCFLPPEEPLVCPWPHTIKDGFRRNFSCVRGANDQVWCWIKEIKWVYIVVQNLYKEICAPKIITNTAVYCHCYFFKMWSTPRNFFHNILSSNVKTLH